MYEKDKKTRITLRLNEEQMKFVLDDSETLGISPSEYIRMLISTMMSMSRKMKKEMEDKSRENDFTANDNQL